MLNAILSSYLYIDGIILINSFASELWEPRRRRGDYLGKMPLPQMIVKIPKQKKMKI
jgi:hypothetical protein